MTHCTILSGSVVPIWGPLEKVLERHEASLSRSDRAMRAVRAELEGGERLIGIRYPAHLLGEVRRRLEDAALSDGTLGMLALSTVSSQGIRRQAFFMQLHRSIIILHHCSIDLFTVG